MSEINEKVADFARELFTNGEGKRGVQLRMVDENGTYLGGWSELVIEYRLQDFIRGLDHDLNPPEQNATKPEPATP